MAEKELVDVFITKYALTQGVYKARAQIKGDMATVYTGVYSWSFFKGNWAVSEHVAREQFERKREAAIRAAKKKLERVQSMVFAVKEAE